MKIALGSDHRGYNKKLSISKHLQQRGFEVVDVGCFSIEKANHIEFGIKVAEKVAAHAVTFGIVVCGSGIGISIAANKVKTIRCALVYTAAQAVTTRAHNNANVLALSETLEEELTIEIVDAFIDSPFLGGVYQERIDVLNEYEKKGRLK